MDPGVDREDSEPKQVIERSGIRRRCVVEEMSLEHSLESKQMLRLQRARAALRSLFVGDALSMPVHWFYNPRDIERYFPGGVKQMEAAPPVHPSSIMSLHSTSGGGRGAQVGRAGRQEIVGDIILRDKRQYWGKANQHYHQGMEAGDNTLNACCARVQIRTLIANNGEYDSTKFLEAYIDLMTADPPAHPDTYAESYHRGFFANYVRGMELDKCCAITHDTPSVGGLVTVVPLAISHLLHGVEVDAVKRVCKEHLFLTHADMLLGRVCDALVVLFDELLNRKIDEPVMPSLVKASKCIPKVDLQHLIDKAPGDAHVVGGTYSTACYITDSWPSLLYLAAKYSDKISDALIANTNLGGENAHRGSVLGSIVSLSCGHTAEDLYGQLLHREEITNEIDALLGMAVVS